MAIIGYMRVSSNDPGLELQKKALQAFGCSIIFKDITTGAKSERSGFTEMLKHLRDSEDTVVVWKLDCIGKSLSNLVNIIEGFAERNINFKSLNDPIDTTSSQGHLIVGLFSALAEFQRNLTKERSCQALNTARLRGIKLGRPIGLSEQAQQKAIKAEQLYNEGTLTTKEICEKLSISSRTLYRYLRYRGMDF